MFQGLGEDGLGFRGAGAVATFGVWSLGLRAQAP